MKGLLTCTFSLELLLQLKAEEVSGIMNDFAEPGSLAPTGLFLAGTKYMVIQGEPGAAIRGKKVLNLSYFTWRRKCVPAA